MTTDRLPRLVAMFIALGCATPGLATQYTVEINTTAVQNTPGALAFDLTSEVTEDAGVVIFNFVTDGMTGLGETQGGMVSGDITFTNPAPATTIADGFFFNELVVPFIKFGTNITFDVFFFDYPPAGAIPDQFSVFLLNANRQALFATGDPLGANALFTVALTGDLGGDLQVFSPTVFQSPMNLSVVAPLTTPTPVFAGTPTNGIAPLTVQFTAASTGSITNQNWNFGDSMSSNTLAATLAHTYNAVGTYTVRLIATGPSGTVTNTRSNYITATDPFQTDSDGDGMTDGWELMFGFDPQFGLGNDGANGDPDGDGRGNLAEFLAGTSPTNSASALRITAIAREGNDIRVGWKTAGGRTNVLEATAGGGNFSNNFSIVVSNMVIVGTGDAVTNAVHQGGATNAPARYYRVRLVP